MLVGTRGATSAEYFLKAGYAVIFMHRQFSLQPFSRHYSHSTHPFLDFLDIDESEVLTPADEEHHINKHAFKVPFVCGARNLVEALRRISEGAVFIRTKGEAGTGNVVEAVRHQRAVMADIRRASSMND